MTTSINWVKHYLKFNKFVSVYSLIVIFLTFTTLGINAFNDYKNTNPAESHWIVILMFFYGPLLFIVPVLTLISSRVMKKQYGNKISIDGSQNIQAQDYWIIGIVILLQLSGLFISTFPLYSILTISEKLF